ncbi:MAG TPA: hypothetical protein VMK65_06145, partial [Longimicrobiales bacterium]|nr:hypothetical protein [Longimicrobiales bacterium]
GAEAALRALAVGGEGLPPGLGFFLRAARVVEEAGGRVVLEVPAGPGLERLSEPAASGALATALGRRLGRKLELEVCGVDGAGRAAERLTPERLREEQLRRMVQEEPVLGKAVKELDLELLE